MTAWFPVSQATSKTKLFENKKQAEKNSKPSQRFKTEYHLQVENSEKAKKKNKTKKTNTS